MTLGKDWGFPKKLVGLYYNRNRMEYQEELLRFILFFSAFIILILVLVKGIEYIEKSRKIRFNKEVAKRKQSLNSTQLQDIHKPLSTENYYPIVLLPETSLKKNFYNVISCSRIFQKPCKEYSHEKNKRINSFIKLLEYYFDKKQIFYNACTVKIETYRYYPVFAYVDKRNQVFVDIEIDKAYSIKDKSPTISSVFGGDSKRDSDLVKQGWTVIRFSTKQLKNQPESCCKIVAQYLVSIYADQSFLSKFTDVPDIIQEKCKTMDDLVKHFS